jgi:hypothetical protein
MKSQAAAVSPALLHLLAAGCGADPVPATVTIKTGEPPALIAFRDEVSDAWQTLPTDGASTFEVAVAGTYRIVIVCEDVDRNRRTTHVTEYARTPVDAPLITRRCNSIADPPVTAPHVVRGTMAVPGMVVIRGVLKNSIEPSWSFALPASTGSYDLVMLEEIGESQVPNRIAVRRGLAVEGDLDLGVIDLVQEGVTALIPAPFTATNLRPTESLGSSLSLRIGSTSFGLSPQAWDAKLVPESLLREGDRQMLSLSASEMPAEGAAQSRDRGLVSRDIRVGDPTSVTLPEPLGSVTMKRTGDRLTASWSAVPAHNRLWLSRFSSESGLALSHGVQLSPSFMNAGEQAATLDFTGVPGFKPEWHFDPAIAQWWGLEAGSGTTGPGYAYASVSEYFDPTAPTTSARTGTGAFDARRLAREARLDLH